MKYIRSIAALFFLSLFSHSCFAMVFDNRFMPLMSRPWIAPDDGRSHVTANLFAVSAKNAYNAVGDEVPLPEIFGSIDIGPMAKSLVALGCENPIKTEWQGKAIPWIAQGKFQGQGFDIEWQRYLGHHVSIGGSFMAMRLHSWYEYALKEKDVTIPLMQGDILELEELRRCVLQRLGFAGDHARESGIGDIDLYLRFGNYWEYACKFHSIQVGGRLGLLIPTAKPRNIDYPSSIPFGGDRHWGIYGAIDALFELKEDWKVGVYMRVNQRFSHIQCQRVPLSCGDPDNFGALSARVDVDPGATAVFSPFVAFESLREGFGLRVFYTLTKHWRDEWNIWNSAHNPSLGQLCDRSSWGSDYVSANVFYDFGKEKPDVAAYPILTFCWDVPVNALIANTVAKTNRISLGVEVAF